MSYEGQAAVILEAAARDDCSSHYTVAFEGSNFDWRPMVREMSEDKNPAAFMNTLIEAALQQAEMARKSSGINRIVLSGGTFQNMYIMHRLPAGLRERGFEVYHHRRVSCNDEGISLGQL